MFDMLTSEVPYYCWSIRTASSGFYYCSMCICILLLVMRSGYFARKLFSFSRSLVGPLALRSRQYTSVVAVVVPLFFF